MRLTLEEMNILSESLEKEQARLHQFTENQANEQHRLQLISQLQQKLRDLDATLTQEEKELLRQLMQEEITHIHGHGTDLYESILSKVES
jgi:hypothetical protein